MPTYKTYIDWNKRISKSPDFDPCLEGGTGRRCRWESTSGGRPRGDGGAAPGAAGKAAADVAEVGGGCWANSVVVAVDAVVVVVLLDTVAAAVVAFCGGTGDADVAGG